MNRCEDCKHFLSWIDHVTEISELSMHGCDIEIPAHEVDGGPPSEMKLLLFAFDAREHFAGRANAEECPKFTQSGRAKT